MKKPALYLATAIASTFLAIVILLLALVLLPAKPGESILLRIPKGASAQDVAFSLEESGLLRHRLLFLAGLRLTGTDRRIQAGNYRIESGSSMADIIGMLSE